jgi:hypothetical protein
MRDFAQCLVDAPAQIPFGFSAGISRLILICVQSPDAANPTRSPFDTLRVAPQYSSHGYRIVRRKAYLAQVPASHRSLGGCDRRARHGNQHWLGLINSTSGLILPYITLQLAISALIMRSMFQLVPHEMMEAATYTTKDIVAQSFQISSAATVGTALAASGPIRPSRDSAP